MTLLPSAMQARLGAAARSDRIIRCTRMRMAALRLPAAKRSSYLRIRMRTLAQLRAATKQSLS